jgi:3-ketosteroid 9alpha-monooxygenase subunit B
LLASAHPSHSYRSGTCLYFTFLARPERREEMRAVYRECWRRTLEAALATGGGISHHHGIGRVRRDLLDRELGPSGVALLRTIKRTLDPEDLMNPLCCCPRPRCARLRAPAGPCGGRSRGDPSRAMLDPKAAGVSDAEWADATASCFALRVAQVIDETHDARSFVLEVPPELSARFRYRAGQFLSFKIPHSGKILTRSYSLASSPECDGEHKITVKRVDEGRVSRWMNDEVRPGDTLLATPPAGLFVLNDKRRRIVFFAGGSGITPVISLIKTALATTDRRLKLVYANRDARSVIFERELASLRSRHPARLEVIHSLDDRDGLLDVDRVKHLVVDAIEADFYLCGPGPFMDTVERALAALHVPSEQVHIERFVSPADPDQAVREATLAVPEEGVPEAITIVLDGEAHDVPYRAGERVLEAARRAGLEPPFSCEEGYCSCCMAKLTRGRVKMVANDCLTPELLAEGWVLTCQSQCVSQHVRIEYPE